MNRFVTLVFASAFLGCVGNIGSGDDPVDAPPDAGAASPASLACAGDALRGSTEPDLRRLRREELVSTLGDLLAGTAVVSAVASDLARIPPDTITKGVQDYTSDYIAAHVTAQVPLMYDVGQAVASDAAALAAIVGTCASASPVSDACFTSFFDRFAPRALRRPVTEQERADALAHFHDDGGDAPALGMAISTLLLTPDFLFHVERGDQPSTGASAHLSPYEVANRIAYRLTATMPDAELTAAAARGDLADPQKARAQAQRLLDTPAGRARVRMLFQDALGLNAAEQPHAVLAAAAGITDRAAFRAAAVREALDFVEYVVFEKNGTFVDLMTSNAAFPRDQALADVYGAPVWSGSGPPPVASGGQVGLDMRAALLVTEKLKSSPILRGVFVRRHLLCDPLPSPDQNIVNTRLDALGKLDPVQYSNREIVEKVTAPPNCSVCHARINPYGFVLERFDPMGRRREVETVYDDDGGTRATHPIDTRVDDLVLDPSAASPAAQPGDAAHALAQSAAAQACFGKQLFRFTRLRMEQPADGCLLGELADATRSGKTLKEIFVDGVVNEDLYWKR